MVLDKAEFYVGTGGGDISKVMGMMRVGGALSFERNFSRHSPNTSKLLERCVMSLFMKHLLM